ncbi:MAG: hypothetical protein ABL994_00920 [Verrucomicrobiales bacterium]
MFHPFSIRIIVGAVTLMAFLGCGEASDTPLSQAVESAEPSKPSPELRTVKDPVQEEINQFVMDTRLAYNRRDFDELEAVASTIREKKALFDNGSWKLAHFYFSFACREDEPESMWQLHDEIHRAWIEAKPESITARIAYADFLVEYGWYARGYDFASTVSPEGWKLLEERLTAARKVLDESRSLPAKDPVWWAVALHIARGQGWERADYDDLVAEAHAFEPTFWGYHVDRAYSLLPRWYGQPGDWEAYAERAANDLQGVGAGVYARIILELRGNYDNIFEDSNASWPKTREGLRHLRETHPRSIGFTHVSALLAAMAGDREEAREMFDQIGDEYLKSIWREPELFLAVKEWSLAAP